MDYYTNTHKHYCGIDLHARNLYMCITNASGEKLYHKRLPNCEHRFMSAIERYREDLIVAVESTYNWYWLADLCAREGIKFVLGHALYMRALHQSKSKNDRIDSEKLSRMTAGRLLPQSYVYPRQMRATRDLLRRRLYFVRERAAAKGHIEIVNSQHNLSPLNGAANYKSKRVGILEHFPEGEVRISIAADLATVEHYDCLIPQLERQLVAKARLHDKEAFEVLQTIDGVGPILALTFLYEIHHIARFPRVQQFCSYARVVKGKKTSNGKQVGRGGRKIGNPYLKWAFSEAAVQITKNNPRVAQHMQHQIRKHKKAGAYSRLSHSLGKCVYHLLRTREAFDIDKFLH